MPAEALCRRQRYGGGCVMPADALCRHRRYAGGGVMQAVGLERGAMQEECRARYGVMSWERATRHCWKAS